MATESATTSLTKAIINTSVAQLPEMIKIGGEALIRHMQRDPINLGAMDTAISLFSQAVLPSGTTTFINSWVRYAMVQSTTHELGPTFGVNQVSQAQSALAEVDGFSETVFVLSNLVAAVGLPKVSSAMYHLRSPIYKIDLEDEAENVVTSLYSAKSVHTQMQKSIVQTVEKLEQLVFPLFTSKSIPASDHLAWAGGVNADPENVLKYKLLQSVVAVSRFGSDSTPISYPIVLNHLDWVVALAVIFGFRLECDGAMLLDKINTHAGTIKLGQKASFTEGTEILHDIRALIDIAPKEGIAESITLRDVRMQALIDLEGFSTTNVALGRSIFTNAAEAKHPETKKDEAIREAAIQTISALDRLTPCDPLDAIESSEDNDISEVDFGEEDSDKEDSDENDPDENDIEALIMLFMIELAQNLVAGKILNLGIVVNDPYNYIPRHSALRTICKKDGDWTSYVWPFFGVFAPGLQSGRPFSTIIGGQCNVIVPSLLLYKKHADLINCRCPLTTLPGTLTIRGKRSKLLDQGLDFAGPPLKEDDVAQVKRASCIWQTVEPRVSLLGQAAPYSYKVYAGEYTLNTSIATACWMDTISSDGDAADAALKELGRKDMPEYVCRHVDSTKLNRNYNGLTVWLSRASLAGKLLVLKTIDQFGSSVTRPIYISERETFNVGLRRAHALGCKHMLV